MGIKTSNKTAMYSYHGSLSLFDDQYSCNVTFRNPADFYKVTLSKTSGVIFERDVNNDIVEEMIEKILFEVFFV